MLWLCVDGILVQADVVRDQFPYHEDDSAPPDQVSHETVVDNPLPRLNIKSCKDLRVHILSWHYGDLYVS